MIHEDSGDSIYILDRETGEAKDANMIVPGEGVVEDVSDHEEVEEVDPEDLPPLMEDCTDDEL